MEEGTKTTLKTKKILLTILTGVILTNLFVYKDRIIHCSNLTIIYTVKIHHFNILKHISLGYELEK